VASACAVTVFPRHGTLGALPRLRGPGLILSGAGAQELPPSAFRWIHDRLAGAAAGRAGNVVILRAADTDEADAPFVRYGNFASVQTVLVPPCATRAQVDSAATIVRGADAVFFAGGDQAHYVAWKGSALIDAVKRVYARGGVVGGGSAGLAIQGAVIYDSLAADRLGVVTATSDAVNDPTEPRISFTTGLFSWPALRNTITDTHLVARDRIGRTIVFLARIIQDNILPHAHVVYALGVDQGSVVVVDPDGRATLLNTAGARGAYLIRAEHPPYLRAHQPIHYTVEISHLAREGERFDLLHKTTQEPWYSVTVDGVRHPAYSVDPYGR
jgi:cyanophycinase-like exopeptidase